ncbi:hypothetical protein [Falsiroseomonas sp.]|uniref:hypothetical protein n=1 Tax=Falsiroseomonas sp. TaxID=2870721 RepID=UPI0034A53512
MHIVGHGRPSAAPHGPVEATRRDGPTTRFVETLRDMVGGYINPPGGRRGDPVQAREQAAADARRRGGAMAGFQSRLAGPAGSGSPLIKSLRATEGTFRHGSADRE